jgi:uncharacterized repeat protein (TIGR03803 family)
MIRNARRLLQWPALTLFLLIQAGCGGGSGDGAATAKYSVNVAASGLVGTGLVLALNAGDQVTLNSNATAQFPTPLAAGSSYTVSIVTQPVSPAQTCTVSGGTGTITSANAPTVTVTCVAPPYYQVGGTVSGLLGEVSTGLLTLQIDSPHLSVPTGASKQIAIQPGGTTFAFTATVPEGSSYTVSIVAQPTTPPQQCTISGGSGTVASANVTTVVVTCPEPTNITAPNASSSVLAKFDQYNFVNTLIQGTDGTLYGTTSQGGTALCGTVFQVTLTGVTTVLYTFAGGASDGCQPFQLLQGSDGNLYGMTYGTGIQQGVAGLAEVFKLTTGGVITTVHTFPSSSGVGYDPVINPDGLLPAALIQGGDGNLYGTTANGGTSGYGTVFQLSLSGVETVLHSFAGVTTDGAGGGHLVYGSDANLYGVTPFGGSNYDGLYGPNGSGAFYKANSAGTETMLTSMPFGDAPLGISLGAAGNFYVWVDTPGTVGSSLLQMTASGAITTLASWCGDQFCADEGAILGNFLQASDGNVYGLVSNYLGNFLANINPSATSGNPMTAYYFPPGTPAPRLLLEGANNIFYGTDGTSILAITNVISR